MDANNFNNLFRKCIEKYHEIDQIDQPFINNYTGLDGLLYEKCWIDTMQWHLEDIIRKPDIDPKEGMEIKRRIDKLNQKRTDLVERIDEYIYNYFKNIPTKEDARLNTETPGWAIDRLSILNLKIYHWQEEVKRKDATSKHKENAKNKLNILLKQLEDLTTAINLLFKELSKGKVIARTYKQMKMYNDPELNPVLREYKKNRNEK